MSKVKQMILLQFSHNVFLDFIGLHTSFSSKRMREENGYKHIEEAIRKLETSHVKDLKQFDNISSDNEKRLIGQFCASRADKFTWGVADRTASIKISKMVASKQKGYFEDRRPGANADPYKIISTLVTSILL